MQVGKVEMYSLAWQRQDQTKCKRQWNFTDVIVGLRKVSELLEIKKLTHTHTFIYIVVSHIYIWLLSHSHAKTRIKSMAMDNI